MRISSLRSTSAPGALPRVHRIICATAPLAPELAREAEDRFAAELHEIYGCSEVGQMAVRRTTRGEEWSCIDGIALAERDGEVWASGAAAATAAPLNDVIELRGPDRFADMLARERAGRTGGLPGREDRDHGGERDRVGQDRQ